MDDKRIIVAMDFPDLAAASNVAKQLRGKVRLKAGLELLTAAGLPTVVSEFGDDLFADVKFNDIPNTVSGAVRAAAKQKIWMLNVHCLGGKEMMKAATQAVNEVFLETGVMRRTLAIGVTILTSLDCGALIELGIDPNLSMKEIVGRLAVLAQESGLDGVVCSPQEITTVREAVRDDEFIIVTPGIRRKDARPDDQKRTMTAREAVDLGATYLVIGRPITQVADPLSAAEEFIEEIS